MCPVCIATAVMIAGSVTSTGGGIAAIVTRKLGVKSPENNHPAPTPSTEDHHG
jgi:hypothetical protein